MEQVIFYLYQDHCGNEKTLVSAQKDGLPLLLSTLEDSLQLKILTTHALKRDCNTRQMRFAHYILCYLHQNNNIELYSALLLILSLGSLRTNKHIFASNKAI